MGDWIFLNIFGGNWIFVAIFQLLLVYRYLDTQYKLWDSGYIVNKWSKSIMLEVFAHRIKKKEAEWELTKQMIQEQIKRGEGTFAYGYPALRSDDQETTH